MLKKILFGPKSLPIVLTLIIMSFLLVLFRMKSVELDYKIGQAKKEINTVNLKNKDLKAIKARLLGVNSLRELAKRHQLKQPKQSQIIVVP